MGSRGARPGLMNSVATGTFTTHRKGVSGGGKFPSSLNRPTFLPRRPSSTEHRHRTGIGGGGGGEKIVVYKWRRTEQVLSGIVFTGLVAADLIIPVERRRHFRSLRDEKYFTIYIYCVQGDSTNGVHLYAEKELLNANATVSKKKRKNAGIRSKMNK